MTNWFYLLVEKLLAHSGKVEKHFPPTEDDHEARVGRGMINEPKDFDRKYAEFMSRKELEKSWENHIGPIAHEPDKVECIRDPQHDEGGGTDRKITKKDIENYVEQNQA